MKKRNVVIATLVIFLLFVTQFLVTEIAAAADDFYVNDRVSCRWKNGSTWYPGVIVEKTGRQVFIHYNDGDKEHTTIDKCIKQSGAASLDYTVGEAVKIKWKGSWWDGSIIDVSKKNRSYKIHYDGYSSSWDEWVKTDRLQKK